MVTAGVYMTARLNFFFSMAPETLHVIAWIGVLTALLAATIALTQTDIKRVLAYSTVSQLGYMFIGVGVGGFAAAIFHLMTHAFFKACLFLGAGSVIHAMHHEQDMRQMGGLRRFMPLTFITFFISVLAIAGTPGTAGFFSKDEILWLAFSSEHGSKAIWFLGVCGAGMTAFYMFRQLFMVFFGEFRGHHHADEDHATAAHDAAAAHQPAGHGSGGHASGEHHIHESPNVMTWPLVVLALGALLVGWIGLPAVFGGSQFAHWLEPVVGAHAEQHPDHALELGLMGLSVGVAVLGFLLAYLIYYRRTLSPALFAEAAGGFFYRLFHNKWYVDEIYQAVFVNGTLRLARIGALFDQYIIDGIVNGSASLTRVVSWINGLFDTYVVDALVNAIANITFWTGNKFRRVQTGNINSYLYGILIALVVAIIVKIRYWS
jgi:NADH-quinone oxidoreductase subunit L